MQLTWKHWLTIAKNSFAAMGICTAILTSHAASHGVAEHVVLIVWDGMRPDFIRPQYTPNLSKLAERGVFFQNHHSIYISSTEVNGTGLATGCYPEHMGIIANSDYRPDIGWQSPTGTETLEAVRRGDLLSGGHYIPVPTVAEILQSQGDRTVIAGTKPVAILHDRSAKKTSQAAKDSVTLYKGKTIPNAPLQSIIKDQDNKELPATVTHPNTAQDDWTTTALTKTLWKKGVPKYSLLWLSDPDFTQHETGPGSDTSVAALYSVDKCLGKVVKALEEKKVLDKTDIMVVSDHGFSTISKGPDITDLLKKAGFKATKKFEDPDPGEILVVGLGGSILLYVTEDDEKTIRGVVDFLQTTDIAGVIFSRLPIEGTFPLQFARMNTTNNPPDLVVSLRWSADKNEFGTPGLITAEGGKKGRGTHASLSKYDLNNTLVAAGPDFKVGYVNTTPTGNVDVAPTILWLLGAKTPKSMDGRVLSEALVKPPAPAPVPEFKTTEATRRVGLFRWRQYVKTSTVGSSFYFDEGNGEATIESK